MKIVKITALVVMILSGITLFAQHIIPLLSTLFFDLQIKDASAIGIIGSADGPTSIIVAKKIDWFSPAMLALFAASFITLLVTHKK